MIAITCTGAMAYIKVKHFVVALTNVCTVKLAQLHQLIRFKSERAIVWPAGLNRTIHFFYLG